MSTRSRSTVADPRWIDNPYPRMPLSIPREPGLATGYLGLGIVTGVKRTAHVFENRQAAVDVAEHFVIFHRGVRCEVSPAHEAPPNHNTAPASKESVDERRTP